MMMNDFGIPMNDTELSMQKNPAKAMLQQQLATSGMEMHWVGAVVGAALSIGAQVIGGNRAANSARQQAQKANEATDRQLAYDLQAWDMSKQKLIAERGQAEQAILVQAANERRLADYKDATAIRRWNYDLMIRNMKQDSLDIQFLKSNQLYNEQISLNARSAYAGREDELRALDEIRAENAFNEQALEIETLIAEGKARARGRTGKSADKSIQAIIADKGRKQTAMAEAMLGAERNTRSVLSEISRDQEAADMAAWAQKMLDPGILPLPLDPLPTPTSTYLLPRPIEEFDFGPEPVAGAYRDPSAAAGQVWGSTIAGIAGAVGDAGTAIGTKLWGS